MFVKSSSRRLKMSDALYFGDGLPGYISNSKMGLINPKQEGTPTKFQNGFEDSKSEFFKLGTAIHGLILEPDLYKLSEMTAPNGLTRDIIDTVHRLVSRNNSPLEFDEALNLAITFHNYYGGKPGDKRTKTLVESTSEYYKYLSENNVEGEMILPADLKASAVECVKALNEHPTAMGLLRDPDEKTPDYLKTKQFFNEEVLTCQYERNGQIYNFKSKIDSYTVDVENKVLYLTDLKTTSASIENFMGRSMIEIQGFCDMVEVYKHGSFHKYHYYRQMYMYAEMLKLQAEAEYGFDKTWSVKIAMVVVETTGKHRCEVFEVTDDLLEAGQIELEYIMDIIYECGLGLPVEEPTVINVGDISIG